MMGNLYGGMMGGLGSVGSFIGSFTWLALIAFLILGSIYFWKEINRK